MRPRAALVAVVALAAAAGCSLFDGSRLAKNRPEPPTFSQYHLDGWECTARTHAITERFTINKAHRKKRESANVIGPIHRHDVGMRELRGHARFAQKTFAGFWVFG